MKIKPTEVITVDNTTYNVVALPDNIKTLVDVYDEVRKDHEKHRIEKIKCESALADLTTKISNAMNEYIKHLNEQKIEDGDD